MTSRDGLNHHNHCVGKKLLIVDDEPTSIRVLAETLPPYYQLFSATSGQEALKLAARIQPDLILLDIRMPDMDGYELFRAMQADQFLRTIPIIFVTALTGEEDESIGLALGAVDYITKPFRPAIVRQRISNYLELKQRRDEQLSRVEESLRESEERFRLFSAISSWQTRPPSFWTKSTNFPWKPRQNCCGFSRRVSFAGSAAPGPSRPKRASLRPLTGTCPRRCSRDGSAKTSTTG